MRKGNVADLTVTRAKAAFLSSEVARCMLHWSTGRTPCSKQLTCANIASSSQRCMSKNKDTPSAAPSMVHIISIDSSDEYDFISLKSDVSQQDIHTKLFGLKTVDGP